MWGDILKVNNLCDENYLQRSPLFMCKITQLVDQVRRIFKL